MDLAALLPALIPSWSSVVLLGTFFAYLAAAGSILPGKVVPGAALPDGSRLRYRCNGLVSLLLLVALLGLGAWMDFLRPTIIAERGLELLSTTFTFSTLITLVLYATGCNSGSSSSFLKPQLSGSLIHDLWFGIQLNPQFIGIDLQFFLCTSRYDGMGWLLSNLSVLARSFQDDNLSLLMIFYQLFCVLYILDYFVHEEWDIIAERLGFMLVFGDLVVGWLLKNNVELTTIAAIANSLIWGHPPKVVGGKLLASGFWGIARHCNYLGDLLLALSFSLPYRSFEELLLFYSSPLPHFCPIYLLILLIWRERRDEAHCAEKYREIWAEYCRLVPWSILPYIY
ncbi:hypothetical protein ACJRO7_001354 [Eucalyptus globulus]|uniref:Delta(14)-sterol reductase n=1 Tax=Eucalyptus globulus TaxID=34317 RepID=A0ABD3LRS9_EUCGL